MSTTAKENCTTPKLETFEWDNIWWEQTGNTTAKRILYIGDSISCGARHQITKLSNGEILCDGFGTSKALDNPYLIPAMELCMQQSQCNAILFNNGLHGKHLSPEEYGCRLDGVLSFLIKTGKPVFVVLSTDDIVHPERSERVKTRNAVAEKLAQKHGLPVVDLYSVSVENAHLHTQDGVHFTEQGYEQLAKCILESIRAFAL